MRLIFTILCFSISKVNATIYYVSNAGNNSNNGTSTGTSWQTIGKVNSSSFSPGDQILFKAGDSWNEKLIVPSSGTSGNVITFGSYGTGVKPVITGLQTQGGFTNVGNVWTATATNSVKNLNTVLINDSIRKKARYPNYGYLTYTSHSGDTSITGNLTGTPNYTGAEAVVRLYHWVIDVMTIKSQSGGTLVFTQPMTYVPFNNYGYFIQNTASALDTLHEWCYDSTTKVLKVYATSSPSVKISTLDTLVILDNKNYITFDGLYLTGANKSAFILDTCRGITIQNCVIKNSGADGIDGLKSPHVTLQNDSIVNTLNDAIFLLSTNPYNPDINTCDSGIVTNNYIKNTAVWAGMGKSGNGQYNGIGMIGLDNNITNNRIDSTGYNGIYFKGKRSMVRNNYITNFCLNKTEGGAIYCNVGGYTPDDYYDQGSRIVSNILINGESGGDDGTPETSGEVCAGIYLDDRVSDVTLDSNTISNCLSAGVYFNDSRIIHFWHNTILDGIGHCFNASPLGLANEYCRHNIYYSPNSTYSVLYYSGDPVVATNRIDSNVYSRPSDADSLIQRTSAYYSLPEWVAAHGYDVHSKGTPTGITSDAPLFYFNPTLSDSTIILNGIYIDINGERHINSITLQSFTSTILFRAVYTVSGRIGNLNFN